MHTDHEPGHTGARLAEHDFALVAEHRGGREHRIDVRLPAGPDAAAAARGALAGLEHRLTPELAGDVRLLVSELVTNSVRHSNPEAGNDIGLRVELAGESVRVSVSDRGRGFEPRPRDFDRMRPGGWGLYLVDRLAARWGVEGGDCTRVWFEIDGRSVRRSSDEAA